MTIKDHFLSGETFEILQTDIPGILRTSPLPHNPEKYYDSKNYISHHQDSGSLREKVYKTAQQFNFNYKRNILRGSIPQHSKVLDYGCGAGEFIKFIQSDFEAFGYEPNPKARQVAIEKNSNDKIISDLNQIPDRSLGAITLWHVFEHIENQEDILNQFYQKLQPGGLLVIAVPNHTSYDAEYYKEFWAAYDVPRHVFHFSRNGMQQLFDRPNWRLEKIRPLLLDSYYISILSEKYKRTPLFWLKGSIVGAISNLRASKTGEFSSLIYSFRKI